MVNATTVKVKLLNRSNPKIVTIKVSKKYAAKSNRKYRGLYITKDAVYNADCVGAYNILRLYLSKNKKEIPQYGNLSSPLKVTV
jgi:putative transposase